MKGKVKFVNQSNSEFFTVLRKRVNQYFDEHKLSKTGDYRMVMKTVCMLSLYLIPFLIICLQLVPAPVMLFLCIVMGIGIASTGMSVMHDANHGAYSENEKVNKWMGRTMYLLGGSKFTWKIQHNILHHTYTNIYGMDEDIHDKPILRLSPHGKWNFIHRYQHIYGIILYGLATFGWALNKDFKQLLRYNQIGLTKGSGSTPTREMIVLIISKIFYFAIFLGIPLLVLPYNFLFILLGFLIMHFTAGVILSTIFQLAHLVEETDHPELNGDGNIENAWAIHQMQTTSNFAHKNRILSWFVGGLNYQIEHHLFHNICHIHYRKIAPIVKQTAKEFNIPYYEQPTFWSALHSHITVLRKIGKRYALA